MRLIAVTTSGDRRSAACLVDDQIAAVETDEGARQHAEATVPLVERTLRQAGWPFASIDVFAVDVGPGSFTGVRIGVAATRAFALALDRPAIGVTSVAALLSGLPHDQGTRMAAIDARRGGIYVGLTSDSAKTPAASELWPIEAIGDNLCGRVAGPLTVAGNGGALVRDVYPKASLGGRDLDATLIGMCAREAMTKGAELQPGHALQPLYLRPADAVPAAERG